MKKLFLSIYYYFVNWSKRKEFKTYEKKLQGALINKAEEQIKLIKLINKQMNVLWPKSRSKFIPLSLPQRNEIKAKIYNQFGDQMRQLNVHINANLEFK